MKDAVGGSLLLNLVIIFTSVVILLFVGIMSYSKAYKVKNKIIEIIERNEGYAGVADEIHEELKKVGYKVSSGTINSEKCKKDSSRGICENLNTSSYQYCVCKQLSAVDSGTVYEVITYVQFEFPVIGDVISIPVKGETKVLEKTYEY